MTNRLKTIDPAARIEDLDAQLAEIQPRKEYQAPASLRREYFQQQINVLTDRLIRWQEIEPEVRKLNRQYAFLLQRAAQQERRGDETVARWRNTAIGTGVGTGVLFLTGVAFGAWALLLLALLGACGTAGAGYLMVRAGNDADETNEIEAEEIKAVEDKLKGLYEYAEGDEDEALVDEDTPQSAAN